MVEWQEEACLPRNVHGPLGNPNKQTNYSNSSQHLHCPLHLHKVSLHHSIKKPRLKSWPIVAEDAGQAGDYSSGPLGAPASPDSWEPQAEAHSMGATSFQGNMSLFRAQKSAFVSSGFKRRPTLNNESACDSKSSFHKVYEEPQISNIRSGGVTCCDNTIQPWHTSSITWKSLIKTAKEELTRPLGFRLLSEMSSLGLLAFTLFSHAWDRSHL